MSVLGILAVNADGFAAPRIASLNPVNWPYPNEGSTAIAYWVMDTFFHDKFVTLFSMLFGVSLYLVGGERGDRVKERILHRRLGVLFVVSMLHGFGLWWGDILSLYAVTGSVMILCRSWAPTTLLATGIVFYVAISLRFIPSLTPHVFATSDASSGVAVTIDVARSSWSGAYRENASAYLHVLSGDLKLIPSTLGLMMIGLALFKLGLLSGKASLSTCLYALGAGTVATAIVGSIAWGTDVYEVPNAYAKAIELLLAPIVSLGYVSTLLLLRPLAGSFLARLAAVGRMAFTNYLAQSLIMTSIFGGGRGALMGQVDRLCLWAIVGVVWTLQIYWSPRWLSKFEMGPCEWAWRCLSYGRRFAFHRRFS